ncbi:Ras and EF-hand domain-containing protein [Trichinella pseudospiralis]
MKFCQKKIDSLIDWVNLETENGIELMPVDSLCALKDFQHLSFIISSTFREEPPFPAERNCRNYVYYVLQNFYEKDLFNNLESLASINGDNPTEEEVAIALCLTLNYALTSVNNTDHVQLVLTKVTTESQYLIKDVCEGLSNPAEVAVNWSTFWERLLGNVDLESNGYTNGDAKHAENQNGTSGSASFLNNSSPVVKSLNSPVVRNAAAVRQKDQEIRRLKETIASKNEIIETLAYDVETLTKTCAVRETELLVLQGDQSSAEALRAELKEKHELLESVKNENALLLEEIKSLKRQKEIISRDAESATSQLEFIKTENDRLFNENMNAQTMIRRMRAEEMMLKSELNEQSVISSEKETNCKRTVEDLMKQIDVLKKEKRDIVDECDELQLKVENLTQANNEIRLNFMRLHEKYRNLKSKLASIEEKEINASEEPPQVLKSFADAAVQTSFILSSPQLLNNVAEENEEFGANEEFAVPEALKSDEMKILTMQSNLSQGKNIFRLPSKESTMPKYISGSSVAESNEDECYFDSVSRASSSSMATVASVYSFSSTVQASQISKPIGNEGDLFSCSVLKRVGDKSNLVVEERVIESSKCRSPHKLDVTAYGTERVLKSYRSGEGLFTPTIKLNYDAMISFANVLSSSRVHNDDGENEASTLNNESDLKWDDRLSVLHLRNQKENVKCAAEFSASHLVRSNLPTPVNTQFTNPAKKTVLQSIRRAFCIRKRTKGEKMNAKTDLNKSVLSQETCTSAASSVTNLVDITENAPQQKIESNTSGNSQKWFSFVINNTPPKKRPNNKKKQK